MKRYACISLFLHFIFFVHGDDMKIMVELSKNLPPSSNGKNWNTTSKNPCSWVGVSCNSSTSGHVTSLSLSGLGLTTSASNSSSSVAFFRTLCELKSLGALNLSMNSLAFVPPFFFTNCSGLSQLKSLNFSSNGLNVNLGGLSSFQNLEVLDLSSNSLQGEAVFQWGGLNKMKSLNLSNNLFQGAIPLSGGLEELVLSANQFQGKIPNEISKLKNLRILDVGANFLNGSIPDAIGALSKLEVLILSSNNFGGRIPSNLPSIQSLSWFAANENNFEGPIPSGITKHLKQLDLSYNQLSGDIPSDLLSPPSLESVDLSMNHFEGPIPGNFSQRLFRLRLGQNKLTGRVPSSFHLPLSLTYLELNNNELDGEIPKELGICRNLSLLNLASNRLQGALPKELGNLTKLVILKLQENNLSGEIPDVFANLVKLNIFNLSNNFFSGPIPPTITSLSVLQNLNLATNRLNGSILRDISKLNRLIELQLGDNALTGSVPQMPVSLTTALNVSHNHLSGAIPSYLGSLFLLEILDLSNNNFSGSVPSSLTQIQSLTMLLLSNNQLTGILPNFPQHVYVNSSGNSFESSPLVPGTSSKKKNWTPIIIVSIVCAIIGAGLVSSILFIVVSKRFYRVEDEGLQLEGGTPQIISGCYITQDSIHRSNIDFARAMEVVGNPSNIMFKTRFSTYYKAVMPSGMSYSVKKLNWSEKIFQMGSSERFGRELQLLGKLSNSNIMLPLAYVLTQDVAYLFYEHVHKGTVYDFLHKDLESCLDWQSRYSIALGVAQGLTFLQGCIQPVLLLDLTTKSIHLKSTKEPQIGDIELCRVIDPSKSTGSLSTVAGSVGYVPPEYAYTMRVTAAGNVYSFGVILLELLTGKPPVGEGIELAKWALGFSTRLDRRGQILDSRVCNASPAVKSQMLSVLKIALRCVSPTPEARPKIRDVLRSLFNAR